MKEIKCQRCKPEDEGCKTCGGYKTVLVRAGCPTCSAHHWVREGAHTSYEGREWYSFDGLLITDHGNKPSTCARCP